MLREGFKNLGEMNSKSLVFSLQVIGMDEMVTCIKGKKGHNYPS